MRVLASQRTLTALVFSVVTTLFLANNAFAQVDFEKAPINYGKGETHDPIAKLAKAMEAGDVKLEYDEHYG